MGFLLNDLHCHSYLSACCHDKKLTADVMLEFADKHDYGALCITDHLWDSAVPNPSNWYRPQDIEHVKSSLPLPKGKTPFYFGCETELPANCIPALKKENFDLFDFVVIPPNHMHMNGLVRPDGIDSPEKMARLMEDRLETLIEQDLPFNKIGIAHLTCGLMYVEGKAADVVAKMDEARLLRIFKAYAQAGAGIELNIGCIMTEYDEHPEEMLLLYRIAKEAGCLFYASSDAHEIKSLNLVPTHLPFLIEKLGLTEKDQYKIPV